MTLNYITGLIRTHWYYFSNFIKELDIFEFCTLLGGVAVLISAFFFLWRKLKRVSKPIEQNSESINFHKCTFYIQSMNPEELNDENVVKRISDCINKNVPKFTGQIVKDTTFEISQNELKLLNVISEKTDEYLKESGKTIKNTNILRTLGNEAYYLGKPEKALEYYKQALDIDEELKDIRGKAVDLNNIGLVYQDFGKPEKALEYYKQALDIDEELKDIRGKATRLSTSLKNLPNPSSNTPY